jgi:hypothetical protein
MAVSTRSKVWDYFLKKTDHDIQCDTCHVLIKVKDGNTTNLHNHLKRKHNITVKTLPPKRRLTTTDDEVEQQCSNNKSTATNNVDGVGCETGQTTLVQAWTKLPKSSARSKSITNAIVKYLVLDMRPLNSVNDKGFAQLLRTLEPRYDLTSRTHISQTLIPEMYDEIHEKVKKELQNSDAVSLTTVGWNSRAARSYITVTAHIISHEWKLREFVLSTTELEKSHTAENLAEELQSVAEEWQLQLSNVAVTTDNASNVVLAMQKCNVKWHVRCLAHVLNLATQKGLKVSGFARLLGRVRTVVGFFHRSSTASAILRKSLNQLELPNHKPVIDVTTRWNSTYDMLERYLEIRPAICVALAHKDLRSNSQKDTLTPQDVSDIAAIKDVSI